MEIKNLPFAKRFTWKKEWVRPYESSFGILLNFCKVNTISGPKALNLLSRSEPDKSYADIFIPEWYVKQMRVFLNMSEQVRESIMEKRLVYCPKCKMAGYHSILHQLYNMKTCPFHNIPLEYDMPDTEFGVSYCMKSIKYEEDSVSFSNARNIPHPALQKRDSAVSTYVLHTRRTVDIIAGHVFFEVYKEGGAEDTKFRRQTVFPYAFLNDMDSYKCFRIKTFEGTEDDLLYGIQTNMFPLYAVSKYEKSNSLKFSLMTYCTWSCMQRISLTDLYIYCLIKNLIGDSLDRTEFRKTNVMNNEILHYHDTLKLKLSFIWAIKGSLNWQDALSFHWVQHPVSGDNRNFRGIRHGIRLETLDISLGQYGFSGIAETLISLYIIDDLFKCLWRQYKTLAKRPQGVSVKDGWRELRVTEYYICRKDQKDTMYLYRKKQF